MKGMLSLVIAGAAAAIAISWTFAAADRSEDPEKLKQLQAEIEHYEELNIYKKLIPLYQQWIDMDPDNINGYAKLSDLYYESKQYKKFINESEEMIRKFPGDVTGYYQLAAYYDAINRPDDVIETFYRVPQELRTNEDLQRLFRDNEFHYGYAGGEYDQIGKYGNGLALVKHGDSYGFVDDQAKLAIELKYEVARPFIEDQAAVFDHDEWYMIDKDGDRIAATKEKLEDLFSSSEGFAVAKLNGEYGYVDENLNPIKFGYSAATNFYNGIAAVQMNGKWALTDRSFNTITEYIYDDILIDEFNLSSRKGIVFAKREGRYEMLAKDGSKITQDTFADVKMVDSDGYIAVKSDQLWGYIDLEGKRLLDDQFEDADSFSQGLAPVKVNGKWGYIDTKGNMVVPGEFDRTYPLSSKGYARIQIADSQRQIHFNKFQYSN